ncbi:PREDICTED: cancer-related nucleoside-triphosphatase homolog [Amphimedon queenslandica]|uniref:AAA+ ATPase domain-containing protein n=1 Tax=Amphimedon queenslandica TaxID=400682 RepID=A0A1X7V029_AMPQE|nr:PREDICTED: cancer-related nucleoside-triphosphatase homolog [Amphimedon queenslandica]|eukprot:XP_003386339.1 PREDICTED: cancer-related nucleoside-triphosphatase homolog [Amphimedon queenslandica]
MASASSSKHVLITGPPGIGKTTLVQSICQGLRKEGIKMSGFYTQELRQHHDHRRGGGGGRVGFDVVTLDGHRSPLARLKNNGSHDAAAPVVGRYTVDVSSFEKCVLPIVNDSFSTKQVLVLDEIGKMELFSKPFSTAIKRVFDQKDLVVLATVPLSKGRGLAVVEEIKRRQDCSLIEVTEFNRDSLSESITKQLMDAIKII